ncbi:BAR domain containing protein [Novymonas esmeraldas]|uniref:BAR domain containing protein n=1 Tax=Novymonas esmeraldas TaxID=1808958 RepID=A0AAW0F4X5_9TRYP
MPLCASVPATVDTDTNTRALYLTDLEKCMKNFNESLASTMNSYRTLLSAFDQVAQVYGNIAQECGGEVRKPVDEFRDGMRDLKDKGGFETFNREIHSGTINVMEPVKVDLKKALKSYKNLKAKQKEYDTVRYNLEQTEKSYAKKDKPLAASGTYKKTLGKREKSKSSYEASRDAFGEEVQALQATTKSVLLQSLNNYLHCTAAFCGQLEATMNGYRTDVDRRGSTTFTNNSMDKLKERAEAESTVRRAARKSQASVLYPSDKDAAQPAEDDFYPKKEQADAGAAHRYPDTETAPQINNLEDNSHLSLRDQYDHATPVNNDGVNPLAGPQGE